MTDMYGVTFSLTIRMDESSEVEAAAERLMDAVADLTDDGAVSVDRAAQEITIEVMATSRGSTTGAEMEARSMAFAAAEHAGFELDEQPTRSTEHSSSAYLVNG